MSIQIDTDVIGLEDVRSRLGNSGQIRRDTAEVLNEAARIGAQAARIYAPKGATHRLVNAIRDDTIQFAATGTHIEASFGVSPVSRATRGEGGRFTGSAPGSRKYPVYVHEGTGLYGRLNRLITPRRARAMVFVGRTGLVVRRTIRGQRPQPFMREAYMDARAYIEAHLDDMVRGFLD